MKGILKKHSAFFITLLRVFDPALVVVCSYVFYLKGWFVPDELARILAIYCGILIIIVFHFFNIYKSWRIETITHEIKTLAGSWIVVLISFNILILLIANEEQRSVLLPYCLFNVKAFWLWGIAVFSGIVCIRLIIRSFLRYVRKHGWNQRNVVIAGSGDIGLQLARYLRGTDHLGIRVKGFFDDRAAKGTLLDPGTGEKIAVLGNINDTVQYSVKNAVDIVFIALPMRADKKINELIWGLGLQGVNVMMAPDLFAFGLQKAKLVHIGEIPVMLFNLFPAWKRIFDILFSCFALTLFSPLMLVIILFIKKEDGGGIFYGHERVREQGKTFKCLKFRTMHMNADKRLKDLLASDPELAKEWELSYKLKNDPRITRIGKFLRKTSLDELPQFINVLKGDMSIVGARPVVKDELDKYYTTNALTYCAMKPGLTGPWQAGKRNDVEDYDERVRLDRLYILNANIWLDLKIIIKTIWKMVYGKGAY